MNMLRNSRASLKDGLSAVGDLTARSVFGAEANIAWNQLIAGTVLAGSAKELCGRSVVVATTNQLTAIATLVELDGVARRIVLYPPDLSLDHLPYVAHSAAADTIVCDRTTTGLEIPGVASLTPSSWTMMGNKLAPKVEHETEWVLLTSGTTGRPKLVVHTLASLAGAIEGGHAAADRTVWSTFYDIRRYGGLQIFLRAALTGTSLVLRARRRSTADFLGARRRARSDPYLRYALPLAPRI